MLLYVPSEGKKTARRRPSGQETSFLVVVPTSGSRECVGSPESLMRLLALNMALLNVNPNPNHAQVHVGTWSSSVCPGAHLTLTQP